MAPREPVEVGSLRVPSPDEAVAVLYCVFLVVGECPRVVGLGPERPVELFWSRNSHPLSVVTLHTVLRVFLRFMSMITSSWLMWLTCSMT